MVKFLNNLIVWEMSFKFNDIFSLLSDWLYWSDLIWRQNFPLSFQPNMKSVCDECLKHFHTLDWPQSGGKNLSSASSWSYHHWPSSTLRCQTDAGALSGSDSGNVSCARGHQIFVYPNDANLNHCLPLLLLLAPLLVISARRVNIDVCKDENMFTQPHLTWVYTELTGGVLSILGPADWTRLRWSVNRLLSPSRD